ncbi:MAG: alpha-amylase family glycosyl hydrolase [Isosphaeraceae bacterium]
MAASQEQINANTSLGCRLVNGGATFRVWAPGASAVHVMLHDLDPKKPGTWKPDEGSRLVPDGRGYWAGFFPGVTDGAPYRLWTVGPGGEGPKRDPRALELEPHDWPHINCIVRATGTYPWHDDGFRSPHFNDLIIYQFHIGVFFAQDDQGNDIRKDRVGKFLDVLDRLDHLVALGVNAIQPLPVVEWQGEASRGYNNSDFFSPEIDYAAEAEEIRTRYLDRVNSLLRRKGLPDLALKDLLSHVNQLKAMVDLCHVYGIAVLLDVVYNHAGPLDDESMRFFDRPWNRSWWDPDLYFIGGEGWAGGRIFDYGRDEVQSFLIDNAKWFLDEYHVDGMRYDEVTVIRHNNGTQFCRNLTDTLRYHKPGAIQISEYWDWDKGALVSPTPSGLGFDATWHDGLRGAIRKAIGAASGGAAARIDMDAIRDALGRPAGFPDSWRAVNHIENHDLVDGDRDNPGDLHPRIPALAGGDDRRSWYARSRSRVATALLLTAPGIPMLFMGQEFLEDKPWHNNPHRADLMIDWDGLKPGGDKVMQDFLRFSRELGWLRRRHPALRGEGINPYYSHNDDRVIALHRWVEGVGRDLIVVATLSESTHWGYPLPFPAGGYWNEVFNSDAYDSLPADGGYNPQTAGNSWGVSADGPPLAGFQASAVLNIPANGLLVLARDRGDAG